MPKSVIEGIVEAAAISREETFYNRNEDSTPGLVELINKSRANIKILAGECDPKFFEQRAIIAAALEFIQRGGKIQIAFHRPDRNGKQATEVIQQHNPNWFKLCQDHPTQVEMRWIPSRPSRHYVLVDDAHLYLEEPNHPEYGERSVLIKRNAPKLAADWEKHFDEVFALAERLRCQ